MERVTGVLGMVAAGMPSVATGLVGSTGGDAGRR